MTEIIAGAHFYDPPRRTYHELYRDISTDPLGENWLAKVYQRSYRPLMDSGVLARMSYDVNEILLHELRRNGLPCQEFTKNKADNVIGTSFIHPILPDLTDDDKRIVIGAGINKYRDDFGVNPTIFWAPEAAMDQATARVLVNLGYQAFVCAPWQVQMADGSRADNRLTRIDLGGNQSIITIVYDREISSQLAFADKSNADRFRDRHIRPKMSEFQQLIFWTDGETYGHHSPFADLFLKYLLTQSLPDAGIYTRPINQLDLRHMHLPAGRLINRSSWSCHCGDLRRWSQECGCSRGVDTSWKRPFYALFADLNEEITRIVRANLGRNYMATVTDSFEDAFVNPGGRQTTPMESLIAAKVDALTSRTSCATFFDNPQTSGRINILFGLEAIQHLREAGLTSQADRLEGEYNNRLAEIVDPTNRSRNLLQVIEAVLVPHNVGAGL